MTIESKHYHQGFLDFDRFFIFFAGVTLFQASELAKMDNQTGEFNRRRVAFITNLWNSYLEVTGRTDTN